MKVGKVASSISMTALTATRIDIGMMNVRFLGNLGEH